MKSPKNWLLGGIFPSSAGESPGREMYSYRGCCCCRCDINSWTKGSVVTRIADCLGYVAYGKTNHVRAEGCVFQNRVMWRRNARKKLRMGHGQERQPRNEMQPVTRRGAVAAQSEERRSAQPTRMRCDAAASRCPRHAGAGRCRSGTKKIAKPAHASVRRHSSPLQKSPSSGSQQAE